MSEDSSKSNKVSPSGLHKSAITLQTVGIGGLLYIIPPVMASLILLLGVGVSGVNVSQAKNWLDHAAAAQFLYVLMTESLVVAALAQLLRFFGETWQSIGVRRPRWEHIGYAILGFVAYYAIYVVVATLISLFVSLNFNQRQEIGFNTDATGNNMLFAFLALVILPPIVEEILFRGFLYTRFKKVLSVRVAAVAVSLLFAAAHLQFGTGNALLWVAALDTFILSIMLVYLRERTGTIWAGVGVHALKNLLAFLILFRIITL